MSSVSTVTAYNVVAKTLHWLIGLAILGMLALGWIMTDMPNTDPAKFSLFQLHKSIGVSILLLALVRIGWRLTHAAPALPATAKPWEIKLAHGTHYLLYALMIIMPITGWVVISTSTFKLRTLLFSIVPWPAIPYLGDLENKKEIHDLFGDAHGIIAYVIAAFVALHAAAALKHHFINRDDILLRMAPRFLHGLLKRLNGTAIALLLSIGLLLPGPAHAASHPWAVDYKHSGITFTGTQSGEKFDGDFKKFTADIDFDPNHPENGYITTLVDITSATAGSKERDTYLPQFEWFNAAEFPQAKFTAANIKSTGNDCFLAPGTLSIKGISHAVDLPFCLRVVDGITYAKGQVDLSRSDYNIGINQWDDDEMVKKAVKVTINIAATPR
ncbi:MAG: cytochrome b/b6 domain-containing protein [Alphaproteobacteria bacterium]|nr:cytochrome b/b6 domain-containing protein [Alphaproteobacteria bacterium]